MHDPRNQKEVEGARRSTFPSAGVRDRLRWFFNILIAVLLLLVVYLSSFLFTNRFVPFDEENTRTLAPSGKPIQLDVLNGCGVSGAASKFTTYLRRRGFDVVEMRNYKSFDIQETLVIDRVGNLATARQVAHALGIQHKNIIQEINPDYFVDVSVVIGRDYPMLKVMK